MILGTGPLARNIAEILLLHEQLVYGFLALEGEDPTQALNDIPVMGKLSGAGFRKMLANEKLDYCIASPTGQQRQVLLNELFELTQRLPINVLHPGAWVAPSADLAQGCSVLAGAVLAANVTVEALALIGANAVLEADAKLELACTIGSNATIGAGAELGQHVHVGAAAFVRGGVRVGDTATIAPGAVVLADVPEGAQVFGNPAKTI